MKTTGPHAPRLCTQAANRGTYPPAWRPSRRSAATAVRTIRTRPTSTPRAGREFSSTTRFPSVVVIHSTPVSSQCWTHPRGSRVGSVSKMQGGGEGFGQAVSPAEGSLAASGQNGFHEVLGNLFRFAGRGIRADESHPAQPDRLLVAPDVGHAGRTNRQVPLELHAALLGKLAGQVVQQELDQLTARDVWFLGHGAVPILPAGCLRR